MPWKQLLGIGDIIEQSAVVDGIDAADKRALLRRVADEACRYTGLCDFHVFEKLFERESLSSTATGGGVAIPVVRSAGVSEPRVMFFRLSQPVEFGAGDNVPVDLVCLVLSPDQDGADYLRALSRVTRILKDALTVERLRAARDAGDIYDILVDAAPVTAAKPRSRQRQVA